MGKKAKEHRKRVAKRNERIALEKKKIEKFQSEFLMRLIEAEKQKGAFNTPVMPMPGFDGPTNLFGPSLGLPIDVPIQNLSIETNDGVQDTEIVNEVQSSEGPQI